MSQVQPRFRPVDTPSPDQLIRQAKEELAAELRDKVQPAIVVDVLAKVKHDLDQVRDAAYDHGFAKGKAAVLPWSLVGGLVMGAILTLVVTNTSFITGSLVARESAFSSEMEAAQQRLQQQADDQ